MSEKPPASTGTWGESIEQRLSFVEAVVAAGHAVGQRPGTAPTFALPEEPFNSAKDAAENPPPAVKRPPAVKVEK